MPDSEAQKANLKIARDALHALLQRLGVVRVISVDDDFAAAPTVADITAVCNQLGSDRLEAFPQFVGVDLAAPAAVRRAQFQQIWQPLTDQEKRNSFAQVSDALDEFTDLQGYDGLAPTVLPELVSGGACRFDGWSAAEWETQEAAVLEAAAAGERSLVLFDRFFLREGDTSTEGMGLQLLRRLIDQSTDGLIRCGLLTHTAKDRFVLISKARLRREPIGFARMVKLAAIGLDAGLMRDEAVKVLREALKASDQAVAGINVYDFEHMVLQSAYREGIWEPDMVFRLINIHTRVEALRRARKNDLLRDVAARLRQVSDIATDSPEAPERSSRRLQRLELYETGADVNGFHLPIDLGDIFQRAGGATKKYILIAQPCELMIRSDGKRPNDIVEAFLVELVPKSRIDISSYDDALKQGALFEIPYFDAEGGEIWFARFNRRHPIALDALDLCVFSGDGSARIAVSDNCPANLLPGWTRRHADLRGAATKTISLYEFVKQNQPIQQSGRQQEVLKAILPRSAPTQILKPNIDIATRSLSYNCKRTERLNQPQSGALLTAFCAYLARAAFEVDFGLQARE